MLCLLVPFGSRAPGELHLHPTNYSGVQMMGCGAVPMSCKSSAERGDLKTIYFVAGTSKYFTSHIKRIFKNLYELLSFPE